MQIVETDFGYKYFNRNTDKVLLYIDAKICIKPNDLQKKPPVWKQYNNMGLATIAFNRMYKEYLKKCV